MARPSENKTAQQLEEIRSGIDVWRWTRLKRSPSRKPSNTLARMGCTDRQAQRRLGRRSDLAMPPCRR
jgi:hypothetical protein